MTPVLPSIVAATAPDIAVFVAAAVLVMCGAFGVILQRNTVHCALSLVTTLVGIAILFLAQGADFLMAVQVIVYAGAIVILFLFVIMLLGVDRIERLKVDPLVAQRPLATLVGVAVFCMIGGLGGWSWQQVNGPSDAASISGPGANINKIADSIFTQYLFPFEATSVLLVIAVVGAVVMVRRPDVPPPDEEVEMTDDLDNDGPASDQGTNDGVVDREEREGEAAR